MGRAKEREDGNTLQELDAESGQAIRVMEGEGLNLQLNARIEASPDDVYKVLTDPTAKFRSIQACTKREVLESSPKAGRRKLAISHRAITRFLFISVTFETHLLVWEDDKERTIRFTNAREGFMKRFEGSWHVRPFTQRSLDLALRDVPPPSPAPAQLARCSSQGHGARGNGHPNAHHGFGRDQAGTPAAAPAGVAGSSSFSWPAPGAEIQAPPWLTEAVQRFQEGLGSALEQVQTRAAQAAHRVRVGVRQADVSLVSLEQHIVTRVAPPPVVKGLMKRLVSKQIKDMLEDLKAELESRRAAKANQQGACGKQQQQQQHPLAPAQQPSLGGGGNCGTVATPTVPRGSASTSNPLGAVTGGGTGASLASGKQAAACGSGGASSCRGAGGNVGSGCGSAGRGALPLACCSAGGQGRAEQLLGGLAAAGQQGWDSLWATREPLVNIVIQL